MGATENKMPMTYMCRRDVSEKEELCVRSELKKDHPVMGNIEFAESLHIRVLKHVCEFFDTHHLKRWHLVPLPLKIGWT